jgi:hypothetical protein
MLSGLHSNFPDIGVAGVVVSVVDPEVDSVFEIEDDRVEVAVSDCVVEPEDVTDDVTVEVIVDDGDVTSHP